MNIKDRNFIWLNRLTPVQVLLVFYGIAVVFSTVLLALPVSYQDGVSISFIDLLFTSVSALSVTGLSTVPIGETFSTTGIILLTVVLHLGAVGVMAISTLIWLFLGRKIGFAERRLIMKDQNQTNFRGMVRLVKEIIILILLVEILFVLILGLYFLPFYDSAAEAFFHGYFTTITSISNGGFDLTGLSLMPFYDDYFVQTAVIFLIIFGAIGFPVLIEVKEFFIHYRKRKYPYRFSLFFRITVLTFLLFIIVGGAGIYIFDSDGYFSGGVWHETFFYALFQSVTTRSGGLATLDVAELTVANQIFMSFLMFVGASPSSSGGGIRTTTFALVVLFIIAYIRGKKQVQIFQREIHEEDLRKAVIITMVAFAAVFFSVLFMVAADEFTLTETLFEVTSAFGTVGLSMGITAELGTASKVLLMVLMFIGRVGVISFLLFFQPKVPKTTVRYPKEKIIIG